MRTCGQFVCVGCRLATSVTANQIQRLANPSRRHRWCAIKVHSSTTQPTREGENIDVSACGLVFLIAVLTFLRDWGTAFENLGLATLVAHSQRPPTRPSTHKYLQHPSESTAHRQI